eukprot:3110333-Rhodomonas_salina.1
MSVLGILYCAHRPAAYLVGSENNPSPSPDRQHTNTSVLNKLLLSHTLPFHFACSWKRLVINCSNRCPPSGTSGSSIREVSTAYRGAPYAS